MVLVAVTAVKAANLRFLSPSAGLSFQRALPRLRRYPVKRGEARRGAAWRYGSEPVLRLLHASLKSVGRNRYFALVSPLPNTPAKLTLQLYLLALFAAHPGCLTPGAATALRGLYLATAAEQTLTNRLAAHRPKRGPAPGLTETAARKLGLIGSRHARRRLRFYSGWL